MDFQSISELYPVDFSHLTATQHLCTSTPRVRRPSKSQEKVKQSAVLVDLRLGTKVRLTMRRPFPWMGKAGSTGNYKVPFSEEEIDLAMRMLMEATTSNASSTAASPMTLLHAASSYYQFPLIYGISVFPRLQGLKRSSLCGQISLQAFGPNFIKTINEEWRESMANLYTLWKCGKRDSFYSLSPNFTLLFLTKRAGDRRIVITPTTSGLRQTLKEKGIQFSLPLKPDMMFVGDLDGDDCPFEFQPVEEDQTVDLDHDEWLRDIGISPKRTLRLNRASALDNSNGSREIIATKRAHHSDDEDNQDSSCTTILIAGEENIETFYKFFTESNVGATRSGPHSGLPSTLLASAPFHRATLRQLEITSCAARRNGEMKYMLELSNGPVLPCVSGALVKFAEQVFTQREGSEKENKLKVQVNGRASYSGTNEAIGGGDVNGGYGNLFEFEFDLAAREYSW